MKDKNSGLKSASFLAAAFLILACGFLLIGDIPRIADEDPHSKMILDILNNRISLSDLPYLPGYHWTIAVLCALVHNTQVVTMRIFSAFFSFLAVASFFFLARKIDPESAVRKSFLFLLFPLLFPFTSLIYTDMYSMMFLFLSLLLAMDRRLRLSGIVGILSLLVRQNNIIWLALIALLAYADRYYPQHQWKDVRRWISKFVFFILAGALTALFIVWSKGFAVGARNHHHMVFCFNNLFFLLGLFFFLFLPFNLAHFRKIAAFLKQHKIMGWVLAGVFLFYFIFFKADHPLNAPNGVFLRNELLRVILASPLNKCLFFLPIGYSLLSLCVTPLKRRSYYLLYPFAALFLIPLQLIEFRYGFIPLALFMLFKEPDSERITFFTLALYMILVAITLCYIKTTHVIPLRSSQNRREESGGRFSFPFSPSSIRLRCPALLSGAGENNTILELPDLRAKNRPDHRKVHQALG